MKSELGLIEAIYDAAINPSRWGEVVERIVKATNSFAGGLHVQQQGAVNRGASYNVDPFWEKAYIETWHRNVYFPTDRAWADAGRLRSATSVTQTDSFKSSSLYNEFLRPQRHADAVAVGLLSKLDSSACLCVVRTEETTWIEPREWHLLETLAPHLNRTAEIHQLLSRTKTAAHSLGAAIAGAGFAAFVLTSNCRIMFANAKAEDLVRRSAGLTYAQGRLGTANLALTMRLEALVRNAAQPTRAESDPGGTLELPRGGDCAPLIAHVFPVAAQHVASLFDFERPSVALFVADPEDDFSGRVGTFGSKFGLTPAETRLVEEIIRGRGILAAATKLKITETTARTHMKRIFDKTGTHRQAELVRRFFDRITSSSTLGI